MDDGEFRREAILGPIIGLVTDTTARVLYEFNFTGEVEVTVQSLQYEEELQIMQTRCFAGIPVAVEFSNLHPDARYKVFLPLDIHCTIEQGSFATMSGRISMRPLMFAVVKGNKESVVNSLPPEERDLWKDLAQRCEFGDVDVILHLGDQVFADDVPEVEAEDGHQPGEEDSVFVKSVKLLYEPGVEWKATSKLSKEERADLESQGRFSKASSHHLVGKLLLEGEWEACRDLILEYYRELYRGTWGHLPTRQAHASASNIMLLDSHDICDSWGDRPCDRKPGTPEFFVGLLALQVYHEYQRQLREDIYFGPVVEPDNEGFAQRWGDVGCIFVDVRCTRSFRCPRDMVEADPPFIDDEQLQMIASCLGEWGRTGIRHVLLCTPTAPVLFSPQMTKVGGYFVDECAEQFAFSHSDDQVKLLDMLQSWKTQDEGRSLSIYSGHLHIGQQTKILKDGEVAMEQFMVKSVAGPEAGTQKGLAFKMLGFGCSLHHAISSTWSFRHFDGVKAARSYGLVQCRLFSGDDDMPVVNHSVVTSDKENSLDDKELEHFLDREQGRFFEKGLVLSLSDGLDQRRYTHVAGSGMTLSDAALFSPVLRRHNPTSRSESRTRDVPTLASGFRVGTEPGPGLEKWEVRRVPGQLGNYVAPADDIELGKTPYQLGIKQGEFFAQRLDVGAATASNGVAFVMRHKDLGKQATNALASRPIPDQDEWKLEYALAYPADSKRPGAASAAFTTQVPGSEFVMHIQKAHHQQIGWDIATAADGDVVIRRVLPNTYLHMHNQVYPAKAATEGDRVMEVNGEKRDVQKIRELEMQRSHLSVHIKKAKPEPLPKAKAKPKAAPAAADTPVPFYKRFPCCQKQAAETLQAEKESEQIVDGSAALEEENTTLRRQLRIKEQENALIIKDKQDLAKQVKLQRKAVEEHKTHLHELQLHAELAHGRDREPGPHLHAPPQLLSHGPASSWEEIRHDAASPSLELAVRKLQEENQDLAAKLEENARLREEMEFQHRQAIQQISTRSQAGTAAELRALKGDNERLLERNKQLSEQLELMAINDSNASGMVDMDRENLLMAAQAHKEELLEKTARLEQELSELYSKAAEPQSEGIVPPEVLGEIQRLRSDNEGHLSALDRLRAENEVLAERNVELVRKSAHATSRAASMDGSTRRMISATSHTADVEAGESSIAAVVASRRPQVMKPVVQTTKVVIPEVPQRLDTDLSRKIVKAEQLLTEGVSAEPWQTLGPYIPPATVDAGLSTGTGVGRVRVLSPSRIVPAQPFAEGPSVPSQQPLSSVALDLSQRSLPPGTAVSSQPAMLSAPSGIIETQVIRTVSGSACSPGREIREPIVANAASATAIPGVMPLGPEYVAPAPPVYLGVVPASQQSMLMQSQSQPQPSFTSYTGGQACVTNLTEMPGMVHEAGSSRLQVTTPSTTARTSTERWL